MLAFCCDVVAANRFEKYYGKFNYHMHSCLLETTLQSVLAHKTRELGMHRSMSFIDGFSGLSPADGGMVPPGKLCILPGMATTHFSAQEICSLPLYESIPVPYAISVSVSVTTLFKMP